ncbi:MAG: hypothetical protein BIFFINMI_00035 [Phycisphaerae bacterium]|nr:hypothetical protein [Phycisphaerae bacterium]
MRQYDRKLARAVYLMALLAILAMVLAEGSVVYFALALVAAVISWPIAHGRSRASVVPRWLISLAVLLALMFFFFELLGGLPLVPALAHFMIFVQVCKFFETKRARDYGQLIVLSMLEIVIAAILSASLNFAVMLLAYMGLCVYTLLLFHFKREMELFEKGHGRQLAPTAAAMTDATGSLNALSRWRLWRVSLSTGTFALIVGAMLFVAFPRIGEGILGRQAPQAASNFAGFTPDPKLGAIGQIKESEELVMRVRVLRNGQPTVPTDGLLLRGAVWDWYEPRSDGTSGYWEGRWHSPERSEHTRGRSARQGQVSSVLDANDSAVFNEGLTGRTGLQKLDIELEPPGMNNLFSTYPPIELTARTRFTLLFNAVGQVIGAQPATQSMSRVEADQPMRYVVTVPQGEIGRPIPEDQDRQLNERMAAARRHPELSDPLTKLARQWRDEAGATSNMDIARAIDGHLQHGFSYSLQMQAERGRDPLETFLFTTHKGHCEYFASAMTVLCQRLGVPARMVGGFKCVEFNHQGNYFIVRQKHAHAWVEVFDPSRGWVTFDPTPSAGDNSFDAPTGLLGWLNHSMDYLNYQWQQRVVNYSRYDRALLLSKMRAWAADAWGWVKATAASVWAWLAAAFWFGRGMGFWQAAAHASLLLAALAGIAWLLLALRRRRPWQRWMRRRRDQRLRARGLSFWADLLRLLDRRRLTPPPHRTPLEVTAELSRSLPSAGDLTPLAYSYYKIRYGAIELDSAEQRRVAQILDAVREALGMRPAAAAD